MSFSYVPWLLFGEGMAHLKQVTLHQCLDNNKRKLNEKQKELVDDEEIVCSLKPRETQSKKFKAAEHDEQNSEEEETKQSIVISIQKSKKRLVHEMSDEEASSDENEKCRIELEKEAQKELSGYSDEDTEELEEPEEVEINTAGPSNEKPAQKQIEECEAESTQEAETNQAEDSDEEETYIPGKDAAISETVNAPDTTQTQLSDEEAEQQQDEECECNSDDESQQEEESESLNQGANIEEAPPISIYDMDTDELEKEYDRRDAEQDRKLKELRNALAKGDADNIEKARNAAKNAVEEVYIIEKEIQDRVTETEGNRVWEVTATLHEFQQEYNTKFIAFDKAKDKLDYTRQACKDSSEPDFDLLLIAEKAVMMAECEYLHLHLLYQNALEFARGTLFTNIPGNNMFEKETWESNNNFKDIHKYMEQRAYSI